MGIPPSYLTTSAVAANVMVGTSTPCPGDKPNACTARWRAAVHEFSATACGEPTDEPNSSSNRLTLGPVVNHPERRTLTTSSISASQICGRKNGTFTPTSSPVGSLRHLCSAPIRLNGVQADGRVPDYVPPGRMPTEKFGMHVRKCRSVCTAAAQHLEIASSCGARF